MLARKSLFARVAASACRWVVQVVDEGGQLLAVLPLGVVSRFDILRIPRQLAFCLLARPNFLLEGRGAVGGLPHVDHAAPTRHDEE